jgi:hypothetical protein
MDFSCPKYKSEFTASYIGCSRRGFASELLLPETLGIYYITNLNMMFKIELALWRMNFM